MVYDVMRELRLSRDISALISIHGFPDVSKNKLSRKIETDYSHTINMVKKLVHLGLITCVDAGRQSKLKTTVEGGLVAEKFIEIERIIRGINKVCEENNG